MRIKIIGENDCARATRHLLRMAGFAVTEFLPAEVVLQGPHAGYAITIELSPAAPIPDPTKRPDLPTHDAVASAQEEALREIFPEDSCEISQENSAENSCGASSPSSGVTGAEDGIAAVARLFRGGELVDGARKGLGSEDPSYSNLSRRGNVSADEYCSERGNFSTDGNMGLPGNTKQEAGSTNHELRSTSHELRVAEAAIRLDSVECALEGLVLRHVSQLAAGPVVVDRPGGRVHSDRELRIVLPVTGDASADEAAAVAVEFGVLRGLLDLTAPHSVYAKTTKDGGRGFWASITAPPFAKSAKDGAPRASDGGGLAGVLRDAPPAGGWSAAAAAARNGFIRRFFRCLAGEEIGGPGGNWKRDAWRGRWWGIVIFIFLGVGAVRGRIAAAPGTEHEGRGWRQEAGSENRELRVSTDPSFTLVQDKPFARPAKDGAPGIEARGRRLEAGSVAVARLFRGGEFRGKSRGVHGAARDVVGGARKSLGAEDPMYSNSAMRGNLYGRGSFPRAARGLKPVLLACPRAVNCVRAAIVGARHAVPLRVPHRRTFAADWIRDGSLDSRTIRFTKNPG